jgi:hypothetical protein
MRLSDFLQQQGVPTSAATIRSVAEWLETYERVSPPVTDLLREQASFWDVA